MRIIPGDRTTESDPPVTERVRLATGIVNPFTRGPAVLAQTAAALQEASEGRFVLGLGSSSDVVVERFNGGTFAKPLSSRVRTCRTKWQQPIAARGQSMGRITSFRCRWIRA